MKLKYLFSAILSSALLLVGCEEESHDSFDNLKVSKTYVSIPEDGGSVDVTVSSSEDWKFVITDKWPEVVSFNKDANDKTIKAKFDDLGNLINDEADIKEKTPSWLGVSVLQGTTGETKVTFTAEAFAGGREIELALYTSDRNKQFIRVRQGNVEASQATCAEVIEGPDGKTFRVKGVCTAIANTTYGNWYLNDGTGEVYIYGTLDSKGNEKNFESWGLEVGDIVECEGPKTTYGSTIELVKVTVIKITKSLAKIITEPQTVDKEGGEFDVKVAYKGDGLFPSVPEEYRSWISVVDMQQKKGEASKLEPNPADTAIVKVRVAANNGGDREGSVSFTSSTSTVSYDFTQTGSIIEATAAEINAAEDGATIYRLTGYISQDTGSDYGNIYVKDATGEVYVYGVLNEKGEAKKWKEMGIKEGDIVTLTAVKTSFKDAPQLKNATIEKHISVEDITVADFLPKSDNGDVYYRLTGTVNNIKSTVYGNFDIVDKTGSVMSTAFFPDGVALPKSSSPSTSRKVTTSLSWAPTPHTRAALR